MKKLLITSDSFPPRVDGVSKFLSEVIPRLSKKFKITVICPDYGNINIKHVKIIKIPLSNLTLAVYNPPQFSKKIISDEVLKNDIIFNHTIGPIGIISIFYASKYKKYLVSFIHSIEWELFSKAANIRLFKSPITITTKALAKYLYNKCDKLLVASRDVKAIIEKAGISKPQEIIPMGLEKLHTGNKKSKFNLENNIVIGYLGRLSEEKNIETLLKAFKALNNPNAKLLLVGDGPARKSLESNNVIITGFVKNINDYLNAMDIFVMPSLTETSSISTLEAMRSGLPVISTSTGYMKYILKDGINGFIFKERDHKNLKYLINELINNPNLRKEIGKNARSSVSNLSWDKTSKEIIKKII